MELNRFTSQELSEVLKVEILGESGVKNLMNMFLTNEALSNDGFLTESGFTSLMNVKENCAKILMWESLE